MFEIINSCMTWCQNNIFKPRIVNYMYTNASNVLVNIYINVIRKYIQFKLYGNKLYNQIPICKYIIDGITKAYDSASLFFINYKIEPSENIWCNKMIIKKVNDKYILNENYQYYYDEGSINHNVIAYLISQSFAYNNNDTHVSNALTIFKYNDAQIIRNASQTYSIQNNYIFIPTKYRFMTVQYIKDDAIITLYIPKSMYIVHNILFTPTFILRCLMYQKEYFVFDYDYSLKIIDHDINIIEIKSNQFILLEENSYKILVL